MLPKIVEEKGLGATFALIIAGARSNWIYVAPIGLWLRMHARIAVDSRSSRPAKSGAFTRLARPKHIDRADNADFRRGDRIELIMDRRCRTSKIENRVDLDEQRHRNIMSHRFEHRVIQKVRDIGAPPGEVIVNTRGPRRLPQAGAHKDANQKARAASNQNAFPAKKFQIPVPYSTLSNINCLG